MKNTFSSLLLFAVPLLLTPAASFGANPFVMTDSPEMMAREHTTAEVQPWEDGLRQGTGPGNYEWWYFDANLDDGSKFVAALFTKPTALSIGAISPNVVLSYTRPDGVTTTETIFYSPKEFKASTTHCDVKIGPNTVTGDLDTYELNVSGKKLKANVRFHRIAPSWRIGAGKVYFDRKLSQYMGWVIPVPDGSVEGTISLADGTKSITGTGYHDHNWGNYPIYLVYDYWYWGRAHVDGYTFLFFDGVGVDAWGGKHLPIFMMSKDDKVLLSNPKQYAITSGPLVTDPVKHGRKIPDKLYVNAAEGDIKVDLTFSKPEVLLREDVLGAFPLHFLVDWLRPAFNPWYLRFDSALDGRITIGNEIQTIQGRGLYELMLLGQARSLDPSAKKPRRGD